MARKPICPQCHRRHGRFVIELRLFEVGRDGGTETVSNYRPDQVEAAMADLVRSRQQDVDLEDGPVDFGLDAWVVDSVNGDAMPVEDWDRLWRTGGEGPS